MSGAKSANNPRLSERVRSEEERQWQLIYWGLPDTATWADIHRMYEEQHEQNEIALRLLDERSRAEVAVRGFGKR